MSSPKEKASVVSGQSETIDPKTFRKGDRVWVEGIFEQTAADDYARVYFGCEIVRVNPGRFVKHIPSPRPIEVGDRVRRPSTKLTYTVVHIAEDWAMLRIGACIQQSNVLLSDLERVEP